MYKQNGYYIAVLKQSACLAIDPITVDHFAYLRLKPHVCGSGFILYDGPDLKSICVDCLGLNFLCPLLGPLGFNWWFSFVVVFRRCCLTPRGY